MAKPIIPDPYAGNILAHHLGPILSREQALARLTFLPAIPGDMSSVPRQIRLHMLMAVRDFHLPSLEGARVLQTTDLVIRQGYRYRDPMAAASWGVVSDDSLTQLRPRAPAMAGVVVGHSGVGKTVAIQKAFDCYPSQVIVHEKFPKLIGPHYQMVHQSVDVPPSGRAVDLAANLMISWDHDVARALPDVPLFAFLSATSTAKWLLSPEVDEYLHKTLFPKAVTLAQLHAELEGVGVRFWLGQGTLTRQQLDEQYDGPKPCLHGSDAHKPETIGVLDQQRICWIKGDLSFESLRQTCLEPEERVLLGHEPRRGSLQSHTIHTITVTGASWLTKPTIPLNPGLVAVIGARGSGKTALADLVAAGGFALSPHMKKESFVARAQEHLAKCNVELVWENGESTGNEVIHADMEDLLDEPHVQYLSQQFVAELCNAEDANNPLNAEIERVIFNAHPRNERMGASNFAELLDHQLEGSHQKRRRHQDTLRKASSDLTAERVRKAGLAALVKERGDKDKALQQDKRDRTSLIPKGNEERAKRLEEATQAAEQRRQLVERAQRRVQTLSHLESRSSGHVRPTTGSIR